MNKNTVIEFEKEIANFYGAPFAVATDSCTHAIELSLIHSKADNIECPTHTYISVPFTLMKLNLNWRFIDVKWENYYFLNNSRIVDASVFWKENSYIAGTYMCLSFQFQKHLSLGRGGAILIDNEETYIELKKLSHDGRLPDMLWKNQDIDSIGYHYYMTIETAELGLKKLPNARSLKAKNCSWQDYPFLPDKKVFKQA